MIINHREKRMTDRYPYNEEILINGKIPVEPVDIGLGGLYVLSDRSFILGGEFTISLPLKRERFEVRVRIQHKQEGVGVGLLFIDLTDAVKSKIYELIFEVKKRIDVTRAEGCRVLLIDDDAVLRKICKCRLLSEGFVPFEVADGFEAKEVLLKEQIDMIVLNMGPKGTGKFNVLGMFKRSMEFKKIPLIAFSFNATEEIGERALSNGADEFVSFTITSMTSFIKTVKKLFECSSVKSY